MMEGGEGHTKTYQHYDIERLLTDADMELVAREIGIKVNENAGASDSIGILCPNPEHADRHFGNCFIRPDNNYICYSCGDSGDVLHMVKQYLSVSFREALETVADICGGKEHYLTEDGEVGRPLPRVLSQEECALVGIHNNSVFAIVNTVQGETCSGTGKRVRFLDWDDRGEPVYAIEKCIEPNPLLSLMREDYAGYYDLVMAKISEAVEQRTAMIEKMRALKDGVLFIPRYCTDIEKIEDLMLKHFPDEKETHDMVCKRHTRKGKISILASGLLKQSVLSPF